MPDLVLLRTASDVQAHLSSRMPWRAQALVVTGLPDEEAARHTERLARLREECGCGTGAAFAACTFVAMATWMIVGPPGDAAELGGRVVLSALAVVLAGGFGKAVGLGRARRALRAEMWKLHERLRRESGEE
jgi:hypothetical protein